MLDPSFGHRPSGEKLSRKYKKIKDQRGEDDPEDSPTPQVKDQEGVPVLGYDYITEEEAKNWVNPNARKPGKHYKIWGKRLVQKWKEFDLGDHDMPGNLDECITLYHDLEQYDSDTVRPLTLKELEKYSKPSLKKDPKAEARPSTQVHRERQKKRKIVVPITVLDIHFEECPVVPHPEENPAYAFNVPVFGYEYAEAPYIPQLISASRPKIKEVLQTELHRKDQIKSAIVVKCLYLLDKKDKEDFADKVYKVKYHRDKQVEEALLKGSGYTLERIEEISIEAYNLRRGTGGSFIPTPKKLTNTKCTINPDNKGLIDPETNALSEKCLQGALDIVKLDGIPMPTPICLRIFNKIEEMNQDISINVWEWNEETATPKAVIASKNFKR
ncbi:hypothetical protein RclHR1_20710003 [Rhizophagus clarus]|uniref:Uncharacterized protein n=1 Tax=Rhizophagus clarus TaxID=94130 RepID=A0A2Z6R4D4_9GLOM|nr:hypothetical protein RclHR1_20710003 [Rhizophagus clarus]